jgi:hypothetical protein
VSFLGISGIAGFYITLFRFANLKKTTPVFPAQQLCDLVHRSITNHEQTKTSLLKLLDANRSMPGAEVCIHGLQNDRLELEHSSLPGPIQHIRYIYGIRAKLNKARNNPIPGLNELVINLENTDRLLVNIYNVITNEHDYVIFTDDKIETLFGIVITDPPVMIGSRYAFPWEKPEKKGKEGKRGKVKK